MAGSGSEHACLGLMLIEFERSLLY